MSNALSLQTAIDAWDREGVVEKLEKAAVERSAFVELFPPTVWPDLAKEDYALGQEGRSEVFSRWLEFATTTVGSIKGGSAHKHLVYFRSTGVWFYPSKYDSVDEAWDAVRFGFAELVTAASEGRWADIDQIDGLWAGPAIRGKTAWLYFPDQLLPVYSTTHLDFWARLFGLEADDVGPVAKNRLLFELLTAMEEFKGWTPLEIMFFLYSWADPDPGHRIWRIAPGELGRLWAECVEGSVIRVGWEGIPDLTLFESIEDLETTYRQIHPGDSKSKVAHGCRTLMSFRDLEEGDVVVANRGTTQVLGIGRVTGAYRFDPELAEYKHCVDVDWFDTDARETTMGGGWRSTMSKLKPHQYQTILATETGPAGATGDLGAPPPEVPALHREVERLLARSGQIVFYGPPGTGKTYAARRHAAWLLAGGSDVAAAANAFGRDVDLAAIEERFEVVAPGTAPQMVQLTFHPSYTYEDFVEGYKPVEGATEGLVLALRDGIFKKMCAAASATPDRPYVLLIDEINRGNIPKVFGELITLIEADKRGMSITLPQSGEELVVPPNLYIIGTMNTADRSIHVMDAALRRRFAFVELLPDPSVLGDQQVGSLPLQDFLRELNALIRDVVGREKQLGHAVLMNGPDPIATPRDFALAMKYELMPLLQEYVYGDYSQLAELLGSEVIDLDDQIPNAAVLDDPERLVEAISTHLDISLT